MPAARRGGEAARQKGAAVVADLAEVVALLEVRAGVDHGLGSSNPFSPF